jgi:hypothetical protein
LPRLMLRTSPVFIDRRGATAFVISLCRRKIRFHWCGKTIAYDQKTTAMLTRIRRYVGAAYAYSAVHVARRPEQVVELLPGLCRRSA